MTVEYCPRCRSHRAMRSATSRVQVLLRDGRIADIVTKTCYCRTCGSLVLLGHNEGKKQPVAAKRPALAAGHRRPARKPLPQEQEGA